MAETNFPNGISVPASHVGNVMPNVVGTGYRLAHGTSQITGIGTVATGLSSVLMAVCAPHGPILAGSAGAFGAQLSATPGASGALVLRSYDGGSATSIASTQPGTVAWIAIGT